MNWHRISSLLLGIAVATAGCKVGPSGSFFGPPPPSATPTVTSVTPSSAPAGGTGFTLTVNGGSFISGAQVEMTNQSNFTKPVARPATTFVSSTQLTAQVSAAEIASPGTLQVSVFNPNFSATSNMLPFVVNP